MRRLADRVGRWLYEHRLGDRGADLMLLSVIWLVVGHQILVRDPEPQYKVPIEYLGTPLRVGIWYVTALIGIVAALRRPKGDNWGFAALMVAPSLRAASYIVAWLLGVLDLGGAVSLYPEAVVWTAVCILVYRLARRPEMPPRPQGGRYGTGEGGD